MCKYSYGRYSGGLSYEIWSNFRVFIPAKIMNNHRRDLRIIFSPQFRMFTAKNYSLVESLLPEFNFFFSKYSSRAHTNIKPPLAITIRGSREQEKNVVWALKHSLCCWLCGYGTNKLFKSVCKYFIAHTRIHITLHFTQKYLKHLKHEYTYNMSTH